MKNGWTGGQYSIVRVLFGVVLFVYFVIRIRDGALPGALAALLFAIGFLDRVAALVMCAVLGWLFFRDPNVVPLLSIPLLLIHALLPPAPFGSWSARKRVDPRGGWSMPQWIGAWIDPGWIRRRDPDAVDTVFYDGTCGLCHRSVRMLIAEDPTGTSFVYSPLGGDTFASMFPSGAGGLPDSIVVRTAGGETLVRSSAIVHLLHRLGGLWRVIAVFLGIVPRFLRDWIYDGIAKIRYRVFGRAEEACPLLPLELRSRFRF